MDADRAFRLILIVESACMCMGMDEGDDYLSVDTMHSKSEVSQLHDAIARGEFREFRYWLKKMALLEERDRENPEIKLGPIAESSEGRVKYLSGADKILKGDMVGERQSHKRETI